MSIDTQQNLTTSNILYLENKNTNKKQTNLPTFLHNLILSCGGFCCTCIFPSVDIPPTFLEFSLGDSV